MQTVAQLLERIKAKETSLIPLYEGWATYTAEEHQAILSLLSQQQTIEQIAVAAAKYGFDYRDNSQHQGEVPEGNVLQWLQWYLSTNPKSLLSQQAVVELTDEEAANDYATGYFISPACYDAQRDAFLAGCQHVRNQQPNDRITVPPGEVSQ